jgi:hypothetical protein
MKEVFSCELDGESRNLTSVDLVRRRGATTEAYREYAASLPPRRRVAGGGANACPPLAGRQSAGGGRAPQMMP